MSELVCVFPLPQSSLRKRDSSVLGNFIREVDTPV
jgi:hypothetical protein